jgi:hypothetical protein
MGSSPGKGLKVKILSFSFKVVSSKMEAKQDLLMIGAWVEKPTFMPQHASLHTMYTTTKNGVKYIRHAVEKCHCTMTKQNGVLHWDFGGTGGFHNLRHKKSGEMILPK